MLVRCSRNRPKVEEMQLTGKASENVSKFVDVKAKSSTDQTVGGGQAC